MQGTIVIIFAVCFWVMVLNLILGKSLAPVLGLGFGGYGFECGYGHGSESELESPLRAAGVSRQTWRVN